MLKKKNRHSWKKSTRRYYDLYSSQLVSDLKNLDVLPRLESRFPWQIIYFEECTYIA